MGVGTGTPHGVVLADPKPLMHSRLQAGGSPDCTMSRSGTGPASTHGVGNTLGPAPGLL